MTVYEMAQKYYPRLWNKSRIITLWQAKRLTAGEYTLIVGENPPTGSSDSSTGSGSSSSSSGGSRPSTGDSNYGAYD